MSAAIDCPLGPEPAYPLCRGKDGTPLGDNDSWTGPSKADCDAHGQDEHVPHALRRGGWIRGRPLRPLDHPDVLREARTIVKGPRPDWPLATMPREPLDTRPIGPDPLVESLRARIADLERENAALRSERDALVKGQRDWRDRA